MYLKALWAFCKYSNFFGVSVANKKIGARSLTGIRSVSSIWPLIALFLVSVSPLLASVLEDIFFN